ncbi:MAG: Rne/Rng family ribonuclease [Candidatus Melainabacteria bacterium]|nr:Rne/Rng family ribonuclease [Candidatus Melainabacteria bacterium]
MRQLVISEQDNVAALMDNGKAIDFIIQKNDYSVGDVYAVTVENIMPSINAVFVKLQDGQMGFLHANDIPGRGSLYDRLSPGQRLLVQIVKEPTGNKGPRVNLAISLPGRYYVLTTENKTIAISRRISENGERDRLRSITNLMKPEELGVVIRTEAAGHSQEELEEDFLNIWEKWKNIVDKYDRTDSYAAIHKESDFLYTTLRDHFNSSIDEVVVGGMQSKYKCQEHLKSWTGREVNLSQHDADQVLVKTDVVKELRNCLSNRVNLPSGGYLIIQGMEALTAIDINSGKFTSSNTLRETVRRTNMEAAVEIARQMRLRNIGGMIIIDFIDMSERADRIAVMEVLENAMRPDKAKPQIGQLSDLCLVEITRKRSGQSLAEVFGNQCQHCSGTGVIFNLRADDGGHRHDRRGGRSSGQSRGYNRERGGSNDRRSNSRNQRSGGRYGNRDQRSRRGSRSQSDEGGETASSEAAASSEPAESNKAAEKPAKKSEAPKEESASKAKSFGATHMTDAESSSSEATA